MKTNLKYSLAKIPINIQFTINLIKEEIKTRKLFRALREVGVYDCYLLPHLDSLILESMGLEGVDDETFRVYDRIIERRSRKIEANNDSIMNQAIKVYQELINEKKVRHKGRNLKSGLVLFEVPTGD